MYPISHFMAGFLLAAALDLTGLVEMNGILIAASALGSLLPDLDAFMVDDMTEHHDGWLHAPFFWLLVTLVVYIVGYPLLAAVGGLSLMLHLFTDFVTGRTAGLKVWYPFSDRQYSLFETDPSYGHFNPSRPDRAALKKHLKHYVENKPALMFEVAINILGAASVLYLFISI